MKKSIVLVSIILISILMAGCGNGKMKNESINSTQNSTQNSIQSSDNNISKEQGSNNVTTQNSTNPAVETNYSNYSGTWVTETNLKDDFKYGMVVSIKVDRAGNLQGQVSDATENLTHISNVDIKGKIQDNKFTFNFNEDGWGHSGIIKLDFKENKIVLTITYSPNSSKNNLWGIGEGTFTLINNNTKINRTLDNLKDGGLQVIENQCFSVSLENYGKVKYISGLKREDANDIAVFYLIDGKNNVLYKLPDFYGNKKGRFNNIRAVSFNDVNNDGLKDIVIIADYRVGSNSSTTPISSIYVQKDKTFINNENLDDKINASSNNKDIASVLKYAKEYLAK